MKQKLYIINTEFRKFQENFLVHGFSIQMENKDKRETTHKSMTCYNTKQNIAKYNVDILTNTQYNGSISVNP